MPLTVYTLFNNNMLISTHYIHNNNL